MATSGARTLRSQIDLAQFTGYPVYFFDARKLIASLEGKGGNSASYLEARLAGRIDEMIGRSDVRITAPNGFYVIFASQVGSVVTQRVNAVCADVLKVFFGTHSVVPESARTFCRPSTLKALAEDLGNSSCENPPVANLHLSEDETDDSDPAESESACPAVASSMIKDMNAVFLRHFGMGKMEMPRFRFAPIWDATVERIVSFGCQPVSNFGARLNSALERSSPEIVSQQCEVDLMGLASSLKGIWHLLRQGRLGLVAVPIHIETLAWSKQRKAYLSELAHVEPRMRALLAFRINGLDPGGVSQLAQGLDALRPYTKRIFVHLPNAPVDLSNAGQLGVAGFGISNPPSGTQPGEQPSDVLLSAISRLRRLCAAQNALAYFDHVQTVADVRILKAQGVRLIAGQVFGPSCDAPEGPDELRLSSLEEDGSKLEPRWPSGANPAATSRV